MEMAIIIADDIALFNVDRRVDDSGYSNFLHSNSVDAISFARVMVPWFLGVEASGS